MESTLIQDPSLKTEGFFKKIMEKLFFITVFITGVICTNYALDRLFSIYPGLPHEIVKIAFPVLEDTEKKLMQINTDRQNRILNYQNEDSLIQDRCATLLKKRNQAT